MRGEPMESGVETVGNNQILIHTHLGTTELVRLSDEYMDDVLVFEDDICLDDETGLRVWLWCAGFLQARDVRLPD